MLFFILKRLLVTFLVVAVTSVIAFLLVHMSGDPAAAASPLSGPQNSVATNALLLSPALIGSFFLSPRFSLALEKGPGEGGSIQRHTQKASYQWGYSYI